uniref:Uncharacterized protein n=1 Tax=viral metagenome TaxID=1070528 RepID=A0A6C0IJZ9_9ZZZZ
MAKTISFTGKHNIDKINNNVQAIRLHMETLNDTDLLHKKQIDMLNKLYTDCMFPLKSLLEKELEKKISGYKAQDIKKELHVSTELISLAETIEKLIATKLRCYYCKSEVYLLYKNVREPSQWTLDRMDNSKGHSHLNTVIACLKCNLQRRVTHIDKFTFTKSLVLKKV